MQVIHIQIHLYMCTYTETHTHAHIHMSVHACVRVHTCVQNCAHIQIRAYMCTYTYIETQTHKHARKRVHTLKYMQSYTPANMDTQQNSKLYIKLKLNQTTFNTTTEL